MKRETLSSISEPLLRMKRVWVGLEEPGNVKQRTTEPGSKGMLSPMHLISHATPLFN